MQTTDRQWLEAELARYTYRNGWTMRLVQMTDSLWPQFSIEIVFWAHDAYLREQAPGTRTLVQIKSVYQVPLWITEPQNSEVFKTWFQHVIFEVEQHESREWLRRDGQLVDDPHKMDKVSSPLTTPLGGGTLPDVRQEQP